MFTLRSKYYSKFYLKFAQNSGNFKKFQEILEVLREFLFQMASATNNQAEFMFKFQATIYTRNFTGSKAEKKSTVELKGDSIQDVIDGIWLESYSLISRKVVFIEDFPTWHEKEKPTKDELADFVSLKVGGTQRKNYTIGQLNDKLVKTFSHLEIGIYVLVYGDGVSSKAKYLLLEEKLLKPADADRAGSESTLSTVALIEKLKEINKSRYTALYASWLQWATYIHRQEKSQQNSFLYGSPPQHLEPLFDEGPSTSTAHLAKGRHQMNVAKNINSAHSSDLEEITKLYQSALNKFDELSAILKEMSDRLNEMRGTNGSRESLLSDMEVLLTPIETQDSVELSMEVTDCQDVDHMNDDN